MHIHTYIHRDLKFSRVEGLVLCLWYFLNVMKTLRYRACGMSPSQLWMLLLEEWCLKIPFPLFPFLQ